MYRPSEQDLVGLAFEMVDHKHSEKVPWSPWDDEDGLLQMGLAAGRGTENPPPCSGIHHTCSTW